MAPLDDDQVRDAVERVHGVKKSDDRFYRGCFYGGAAMLAVGALIGPRGITINQDIPYVIGVAGISLGAHVWLLCRMLPRLVARITGRRQFESDWGVLILVAAPLSLVSAAWLLDRFVLKLR